MSCVISAITPTAAMTWLILIDDAFCKKQLQKFLKRHSAAVQWCSLFQNEKLLVTKQKDHVLAGKICLNTLDSVVMIDIEEIIRCESSGGYTVLHLKENKSITVSKTLKLIENLLPSYRFIRTHQSHLINSTYITRYERGKGGYVHLSDKSRVPVATRKKTLVLRTLEEL